MWMLFGVAAMAWLGFYVLWITDPKRKYDKYDDE
jgi:hypothetical protein